MKYLVLLALLPFCSGCMTPIDEVIPYDDYAGCWMQPEIEVLGEAYVWQYWKIERLKAENSMDDLGLYLYNFDGAIQTMAKIKIIKTYPFQWKSILRHERGHHEVTQQCRSFEEARKANDSYDDLTNGGRTQWMY